MAGSQRRLSIHNFRSVFSETSKSFDSPCRQNLYRSSRPDLLQKNEVGQFNSYGFKCIIDLRSYSDFCRQDGDKILLREGHFRSYAVKLPKGRTYRPGEAVEAVDVSPAPEIKDVDAGQYGRHYLINFFTMTYILTIIRRAPWYVQLASVFVLIYDTLMRNGKYYFIKLYAKFVINKEGLSAAYIDMIEMSKNSIAAALKLLCKEENIPALVNCAHGKDRTGLVAAMVQHVLGESREQILHEYSMSEELLEPIRHRLHEEIVARYNWDISFIHAHPATLAKALDHIDHNYGSVTNYLESIGFGASEQEQLRTNMLQHRARQD